MKKAIAKSRTTPKIFVEHPNPVGFFHGPRYAKATLQNKKGYVYLQWKEGDTVRSLYIGKAPRSSPTASVQGLAAAGTRSRRSGRTRKPHKVGQKASRTRRGTKG